MSHFHSHLVTRTIEKCVTLFATGCFNLDPNRVLDIILESFETRPEQNKLFVGLLKAYMPNGNIICEVLGSKYRHFSDTKTPSSLYIITALLLQSKIICLDDIYSWVRMIDSLDWFELVIDKLISSIQLSPTDKSIQIDWETDLDEAKEQVRKLNIISINNTNKEPELEVEKEENDVNTFFGLFILTAIICIKICAAPIRKPNKKKSKICALIAVKQFGIVFI